MGRGSSVVGVVVFSSRSHVRYSLRTLWSCKLHVCTLHCSFNKMSILMKCQTAYLSSLCLASTRRSSRSPTKLQMQCSRQCKITSISKAVSQTNIESSQPLAVTTTRGNPAMGICSDILRGYNIICLRYFNQFDEKSNDMYRH